MDSKQILARLSVNDIIKLMTEYFQIPYAEEDSDEYVRFLTMCHNEDPYEASYKLYLYKDTKELHCYTSCGHMSLYDLIMELKGITFAESVEFVKQYFHIGEVGIKKFGRTEEERKPMEIVPYVKKKVDFNEKLPIADKCVLNTLINYHAVEWLQEDISHKTMDLYNIKFDLYTNSIIIPHNNIDGNLVGIRQRNLGKKQIEIGRKYVPFVCLSTNQQFRHKLSMNLYGLDINKERIQQSKKAIVFEAEKSVLKMDSVFGINPSVSVCGSTISEYQLNLLRQLGVEEIYIAFDKEEDKGESWKKKMNKLYKRIVENDFKCFVIEDTDNLLDNQESPIDKGKKIFLELLNNAKEFVDKR